MKRAVLGLTLVEMAIVVTIVGFVAAFALPAYRDRTVRQKVAEVVATAHAARATVDDYATTTGGLPSTQAIVLPFPTSRYVLSNTWNGTGGVGTISVATRPTTSQDESELNSKAVVLTGTWNAQTRSVDWVCGGTAATTVHAKYLPLDCQ